MKRTIAVFLSSIFLLLLFDSNVWASCGPKEYDVMSGVFVCNNLAGQNEPCGPNPGDWCCTTAAECSSVPTPTPTTTSPDCAKKVGSPVPSCPGGYPVPCTSVAMLGYCCKNASLCGSFTPAPTSPPAAGPTIEPYNPECSSFGGSQGIKTALGCLPTEVNRLFRVASGAKILVWAIGLGSGVAFLLGLYGAFLIVSSSGEPEKVQAGKELITSVIMGLMVIISSIFLLRITTGTILGLF